MSKFSYGERVYNWAFGSGVVTNPSVWCGTGVGSKVGVVFDDHGLDEYLMYPVEISADPASLTREGHRAHTLVDGIAETVAKFKNYTPPKYHTCEFIDPGFGDELWCKHDGCKRTKPRWERVGWNVGDRVMTYNGGEGTVVSVTGREPYPVKVEFDRGGSETFTAEGQRYTERSSYADDLKELKE